MMFKGQSLGARMEETGSFYLSALGALATVICWSEIKHPNFVRHIARCII